jgi:hypothetical protein
MGSTKTDFLDLDSTDYLREDVPKRVKVMIIRNLIDVGQLDFHFHGTFLR